MGAEEVLAGRLSYAQCWEDPRLLREALCIQPTSRVLSIASGGCNSLDLALAGAQEVVAVDLSEPQLALTELKMAGADLDYEDFLILLGLLEGDAWSLYKTLRPSLSEPSQRFLDSSESGFESGLLASGKFESYFATFRKKVIPLVHSKKRIRELLSLETLEEQHAFFENSWNTWRWRGLFRMFFSRFVMARLGRSKAHFEQVEGKVADRLLERTEHVLTQLPVRDNPFLQWILTGEFLSIDNSHTYLSEAGHAQLKDVRERVRLKHGSLVDVLNDSPNERFDAFNLSNIGEYLDPATWESLYTSLVKGANPQATFAYWNLFVPRSCPDSIRGDVLPLPELSASLIQKDRAFFYSAFQVERVQ